MLLKIIISFKYSKLLLANKIDKYTVQVWDI